MTKQLIVIPQYGLANRLRTVAATHSLARLSRRKFGVLWEPDAHCFCEFSDLFEPVDFLVKPADLEDAEIHNLMEREGGDRMTPIAYFGPHPLLAIRTAFPPSTDRIPGFSNRLTGYLLRRFTNARAWSFLRGLRPVETIRKQISLYPSENTVGVHIRRIDESNPNVDFPDFAQQFHDTTLDLFKDAMNEELKRERGTQFFLATNKPEIEEEFSREFGEALHTYEKSSYSREDPRGIQDALVDLIALSRAKSIIGTKSSSFGRLAAKLGGTKITYPLGDQ